MNKLLASSLFLLTLVFMSGCSPQEDNTTQTNTTPSENVQTTNVEDQTETMGSEEETKDQEENTDNANMQFGEISKVYAQDGKFFVDFDDMEWLDWTIEDTKDKERIIAEMEKGKPGACTVESDCLPRNGYYILNEVEGVKAIEITDAKVELLNGTVDGFKDYTPEEFSKVFNTSEMYGSPYYEITMGENGLKLVHQVYTP